MKPRRSRALATVSSALFLVVGFIGAACSSSTTKGPEIATTANPTTGQPATNNSGAQIGITDTPSSQGTPAEDRPQMNASAKASYQKAMNAWQAGDLEAAKTGFIEATKADPRAYQAFYSLGVIQERLGENGALDSYQSAYAIIAGYEPAIVAYGLLMARKNQLSEADEFLTQKQQQLPKSAAVLAALAEVKSLKKDTGTAQQLAQEALKQNPKYEPAMMVLARDHYRNRRLDLSLYALKAVLDGDGKSGKCVDTQQSDSSGDPNATKPADTSACTNPPRNRNNAEGHLLRAIIFREQSKRTPAMESFAKAIELRPDLVEARIQLAAYLLESGDAESALPHLDTAIKYDKDNVRAHLNRADAYRLLGKTNESKSEFEWVAKKDSSMPQIYYGLGLLYLNATSMPGMDAKTLLTNAISSLEKYQQLRPKTASDDSEQLITRAKAKKDALDAADKAAAAQSAAAVAASAAASASAASSGSASASPATSGSAPAAASASASATK